jgi:tetratricopeptide (TPR) repeat protein
MRRPIVLPVLVLLMIPGLTGCGKIKARAELKNGNTYYQQESYTKALAQYQRGLELDPDATFAYRSLGLTALALYRPGDESAKNKEYGNTAIESFEKYLADYPDDEKVQEYLMATYSNMKRYDDALEYLETQVAEHQGEPERLAQFEQARVNLLTQAGRLEQAWKVAQNHQGPDRPEMLYTIGVSAWDKSFRDPTIDAATRERIVDMGLQSVKAALDARPEYFEAMAYYNLLFREKAKLATDPAQQAEYTARANEWQQKAIALRKKQQAEEEKAAQQAAQASSDNQG